MLFRLADWPIRRKLALLVGVGVVIALLLACTAFIVRDVRLIRESKVKEISALAHIVGFNATAALEFNDPETAQDVLASLRLQPSLQAAALFDAQGQRLAVYPFAASCAKTCPPPTGAVFTADGHLAIAQRIYRDGDLVGTVYLRSNLDEIGERFADVAWIAIAVITVSLAVALLITYRLQRLFTAPIYELADVMARISRDGDSLLHVKKYGGDEMGVLCDGFNRMVDQIGAAHEGLQRAHDVLEERVIERTASLQQEVAERKRTEIELAEAKNQAEAANRAKSEFLANMSHEIRTPMTAILGFSEILIDSISDPGQLDAATTVKRNGEYLVNIINDILDLSKIEAGKLEVERVECTPCQLLSDVASLMRVRAHAKNVVLELRYDGPMPQTIKSDPIRLRQILINLAGNAIKFTEAGKVQLVARLLHAQSPQPRLQIEVVDSGIGMTEEQVSKLFRPFSQVDTSASRKHGGTGLGLAISKRLASKLGGDITVSSVPGEGSTFTVTVATGSLANAEMLQDPAEAQLATRSPEKPVALKTKLDCRVLLAEDGPDNQRLISFLLKKAGAEVTLADNGQIACERALAARDENRPFDVILMDMQMPVLDGYEATAKLREVGYTGPILALTAHAMSTDREKSLDSGCNDYVTKPLDRQRLLAVVGEYAEHGASANINKKTICPQAQGSPKDSDRPGTASESPPQASARQVPGPGQHN